LFLLTQEFFSQEAPASRRRLLSFGKSRDEMAMGLIPVVFDYGIDRMALRVRCGLKSFS
jgi:hypothetical protein